MPKIRKIPRAVYKFEKVLPYYLTIFWAVGSTIVENFGKTGFFPEKRPCTFLALIVVNLIAKYEENPWSRF